MKKYFTKYMPIKGEIQENDTVIDEFDNIYKVVKGKITPLNTPLNTIVTDNFKKANLFLCSMDIEKGDKVYNDIFQSIEPIGVAEELHSDLSFDCVKELGAHWMVYDYDENNKVISAGDLHVNQLYKVVAEISEYAKWVKAGDSFDENEIEFENSSNDKRTKYVEVGDPVYIKSDGELFEREGILKSIQLLDTEFNSYDWDDIWTITNVKKLIVDEDEFTFKAWENLPDLEVKMREVRFKPIYFQIAKIKCSQCETFH